MTVPSPVSLLRVLGTGLVLALAAGLAQGAPDSRWARLSDTLFQHVTAEHGPPNLATSLAEDGDGFVWIGSFGGLGRWDGYRMRAYGPDPSKAGALPDSIIQALHTDRAGRLWLGTNAHGLARYERDSDSFYTIGAGPDGLSHVSVLALSDDGSGGLWVGTDAGVDHISAGGVIERQSGAPTDRLPDSHARALLLAPDASLWIGTSRGLVRRAAGNGPVQVITLPTSDGAQPEVDALCQSSDGAIWVGTRGHGAFVVDQNGARAVNESGAGASLANESVYSAAEARPGEVWLGTFGQGIVAVDTASGQTHRLRHDARVPTSLVNDSVWAILRDRAGVVWAATGRGISRTDPRQFGILNLLGATSRADGISDSDVFSVLMTAEGKLWAGLGNLGVDVLDPLGVRSNMLRPDPATPQSALPKDRVVAMADGGDRVFLATPRGVYQAGPQAGRVTRLALPGPDPALRINALALVGKTLWVGGRDDGLFALDLEHGGARVVGELGDQRVTSLLAAGADALWIGTRNGLNRLDLHSGTIEVISASQNDPGALSSGYVTSLCLDQRGQLWVGTFGGGVHMLSARTAGGQARFKHVTSGLPSMNIAQLLAAPDGAIWASTENGLARIDPASMSARALQRADGVGISTFWIGSGAVGAGGELIFGGVGGMVVVRPNLLTSWRYQPPLVVTDVRVGGRALPASRYNSDPHAPPLLVQADANSVAVEFSALDFSAPERNHYAYRLDGYDRDWIDTDASRRVAAYTNLPPGEYQLLLRGSNRDAVYSSHTLSLPLKVLPAWYQSLWWRALVLLATLALLAVVVRQRTAYLRRRQRQLEAEVTRQTSTLREQQVALVTANDELALSADTLRLLGEVGRDITANLDANAVFAALYRHVSGMLDAPALDIYRLDAGGVTLERAFGRAGDASVLGPARVRMDDSASDVARAARTRSEVLLDDEGAGLHGESAPLIADDRVLGVMRIGAAHSHAYGERERLIFHTLCAYGAIALANAEARAKLVQQEKIASLGGLVAGLAHEVNTPLGTIISAISGSAAVLRQLREAVASGKISRAQLETAGADMASFIDMAQRNAMRAVDLIDSFKSIVARRDTEQHEQLDLGTYLPQVATMVHRQLEDQGHTVTFDVEPGLVADTVSEALTEVMTRVLENVIDHAFVAGQQGQLRIAARRGETGRIEIVVADNGLGIAADDLPRVFDPFFTTCSGIKGHVGLGLNVAFNHVTERLKGSIRIDSAPGAGTVVTIRY